MVVVVTCFAMLSLIACGLLHGTLVLDLAWFGCFCLGFIVGWFRWLGFVFGITLDSWTMLGFVRLPGLSCCLLVLM